MGRRLALVVSTTILLGCAELGMGRDLYRVTIDRDSALPIRLQWQSAVEFGAENCESDVDLTRIEIVWSGLSESEASAWSASDSLTCDEAIRMRNAWRVSGTNVLN